MLCFYAVKTRTGKAFFCKGKHVLLLQEREQALEGQRVVVCPLLQEGFSSTTRLLLFFFFFLFPQEGFTWFLYHACKAALAVPLAFSSCLRRDTPKALRLVRSTSVNFLLYPSFVFYACYRLLVRLLVRFTGTLYWYALLVRLLAGLCLQGHARATTSRSHYAFLRILLIPRSRYPISYAWYAFLQDFNKLCAARVPCTLTGTPSCCAYCESRACPLLCAARRR